MLIDGNEYYSKK